jgi:hypothetical protein
MTALHRYLPPGPPVYPSPSPSNLEISYYAVVDDTVNTYSGYIGIPLCDGMRGEGSVIAVASEHEE